MGFKLNELKCFHDSCLNLIIHHFMNPETLYVFLHYFAGENAYLNCVFAICCSGIIFQNFIFELFGRTRSTVTTP